MPEKKFKSTDADMRLVNIIIVCGDRRFSVWLYHIPDAYLRRVV